MARHVLPLLPLTFALTSETWLAPIISFTTTVSSVVSDSPPTKVSAIISRPASSRVSRSQPSSSAASSGRPVSSGSAASSGLGSCTLTETVTITPTPITSTVVTTNTSTIDGVSAQSPIDPSTVPATVLVETSMEDVLTYTLTDYSVSEATYTQFPLTGFIPVVDTLPTVTFIEPPYLSNVLYDPNPNAVNKRQEEEEDEVEEYSGSSPSTSRTTRSRSRSSCAQSTTTVRSTTTAFLSTTTVTITVYTTWINWPGYGTSTPYDSYTAVTPTRTSTITSVDYARTTTARVNAYTETSKPTGTKTVYAACATNNFANYAVQPNGDVRPFTGSDDPYFLPYYDTDSAYTCCALAIRAGAGGWLYRPGSPSERNCAFMGGFDAIQCKNGSLSMQYRASLGASQSPPDFQNGSTIILGNGYCGEWTVLR